MTPDLTIGYRIAYWRDCLDGLPPKEQKSLVWDAYRARIIDRYDRNELIDQLDLRDA